MIVLAVASPWYIRNWASARDPIWPFGYDIFRGRFLDEETARAWTTYSDRTPGFGGSPRALILGPWNYTLRQDELKIDQLAWPAPVIFLALLPGLALCWRNVPEKMKPLVRLLLLMVLLSYVGWVYSLRDTRYLLVVVPVLAAGTALVIGASMAQPWGPRILILPVFGLAQVFNLGYALVYTLQFFPVVFGFQDRDAFLERRISLYTTMEFMNEQISPDRSVLLFMPNNFRLDGPKMLGDNFYQSWWFSIDDYRSDAAFASRLVDNGVTHVLFDGMFGTGFGVSLRAFGFQPDLIGNVIRPLEGQGCLTPIYNDQDFIVRSRVRQRLVPVDVTIYEVRPESCVTSLAESPGV